MSANNNEIIKLNVGGMEYMTSRATLTKYPDSMLGAMFSHDLPSQRDENGCFFIDRHKRMFEYILQFLRCGQLKLPDNFNELDLLQAEADFYQIEPLIEDLKRYEEGIQSKQALSQCQQVVLICSFRGNDLYSQIVDYNRVYIQGENGLFTCHKGPFFFGRLSLSQLSSYLQNDKNWILIENKIFDEISAVAFLFLIGLQENPFRRDLTYKQVDVQLWKLINL